MTEWMNEWVNARKCKNAKMHRNKYKYLKNSGTIETNDVDLDTVLFSLNSLLTLL